MVTRTKMTTETFHLLNCLRSQSVVFCKERDRWIDCSFTTARLALETRNFVVNSGAVGFYVCGGSVSERAGDEAALRVSVRRIGCRDGA